MTGSVRVVVADDNPIVRMGVTALLDTEEGIEVVGAAADGAEAVRLATELRADVVLLDIRMPVRDGLSVIPELTRVARVLVLTYSEEAHVIVRALRSGATGYLVHGQFRPEELASAVRDSHADGVVMSPAAAAVLVDALRGQGPPAEETGPGTELSRRELEVMDLVAGGRTNPEIAAQLFLSPKTVANHINHIYAKLGVGSRGAAIATWLRAAGPGRPGTGDPGARSQNLGEGMSDDALSIRFPRP